MNDDAPTSRPSHRWFVPALAALPFAVAAVVIAARRPDLAWADDRALIELAVRDASRLRQLTGNGSRFGWKHPGPALYYLLAPGYRLSGSAAWSITVVMLSGHAAAAAGCVLAARRLAGRTAAAIAAAGTAAMVAATAPDVFTNVWPPYFVVIPLTLVVLLAALGATDEGAWWALPVAAVVASVLIQTKVEMGVVTPVVLLAGLVLRWRRMGNPLRGATRAGFAVLVAAFVLAWVPVALEEVRHDPGNVTLLWRFATGQAEESVDAGGGYGPVTALRAVGDGLGSASELDGDRLFSADYDVGGGTAPVVVALGYVAALAGVAIGTRSRRPGSAAAAVCTLAGIAAAAVWVTRIRGPVHFYLLAWVPGLAVAAWVAWAAAFRERRRVALAVEAVAVVAATALTVVLAGRHDYDRSRSAEVRRLAAALPPSIGGGDHVLLDIAEHERWMIAAGLAVELDRRGAHPHVADEWVFLFGDRYGPRPADRYDAVLTFDADGMAVSETPD